MKINAPYFNRIGFAFILLVVLGCSKENREQLFDSSKLEKVSNEGVDRIVEAFILAEDGTTIEIPEGYFDFRTQLILDDKKNVTILGQGMDKTVLSFRNLRTGGEGVKLVGENIVIKNLSIEDAPGDGVKAQHTKGITFKSINVTWTNGDKSKNGTYAIYPVQCDGVIVDGCVASHSRDAGIYVGQSTNIEVKNNLVFGNVAGIEIENSDQALVFDNEVRDNTGGILVFNLPGLPKSDGFGTKIYHNKVLHNNHRNFALESETLANGNPVSLIPPGTGIILMAAKEVEVFENQIHRNKTVGVSIASYQITGFPTEGKNWSPYSKDIKVYNNDFKRPMAFPDLTKELGKLIAVYNAHGKGKSQDIIYDGFFDNSLGIDIEGNPMNICISEPQMENLHFTRFSLGEGRDNIRSFSDIQPFTCNL
jgi:parallel beta-helix repeat protein